MRAATIIGIDLSGPASPESTAISLFRAAGDKLKFIRFGREGTDEAIRNEVSNAAKNGPVVVGLDAPLSYEPGGGQRKRDADLRRLLISKGLKPGSVMAPTFNRMAWLTLRGMGVARLLGQCVGGGRVKIVEVHPGGAMVLAGAPAELVRSYGSSPSAAYDLLRWLSLFPPIEDLAVAAAPSSHSVASVAAAIAAWGWRLESSKWKAEAELPWHPYDFAC